MDPELLYAKYYQALTEQRYLDAKNIIYQAHREGMPAGHILVKLVNRALDQLQRQVGSGTAATRPQFNLAQISQQYFESLVSGNRAKARKMIGDLVDHEVPAADILLQVINPAMDAIGQLQSRQEISVAQIFLAAKLVEEAMGRLVPLMPSTPYKMGKIIIGNAFGDHHAIGRKIVATFLRSYGFEVIDLGMSVPNEKFVEQAVQQKANLIFVSAFLLHTAQQILGIRQLLQARQLNHIKLVGGGAPFNFDNQFYKRVGCDATATNALVAVQIAKNLLQVS